MARIGRLSLLEKLFDTVYIPQAVYREVVLEGAGKPGSREVEEASWIRVASAKNLALKRVLEARIDEGEAEAIVLALELGAEYVVLDEREARLVAKRLGLSVAGTLGVLLWAKKQGLVENLAAKLEKLKSTGYRVSRALEERILREAGEA